MKIAYFSDNFYPELSGVSDSLLLLGKEMAARGHEVHFFAPRYGTKEYARVGNPSQEPAVASNIHIHRLFSFPATSPTNQGRAAVPNVFRGFFSKERFDIVHSQQFFGTGIDGLCFAKAQGIPFVGTNHTLIESFSDYNPIKAAWATRLLKRYVIWYYNKCDLATAPSQFLIDDMLAAGLRAPSKVVSNPINAEYFERTEPKEDLKKKFGFSAHTILYIGRIASEKGVGVLFQAFIDLQKEVPDAMLVFVGGGIMKKELMETVQKSGMESHVKFLGPYIGDSKQILTELYQAADIFASASTSEIQSMTMLQAMASGIPILAAAAGGTPSFLHTGAVLFEPVTSEEMAVQLKKLCADSTLRAKLGAEGYEESIKISSKSIAAEWEHVYEEVIKNKQNLKNS